MIFLRIKKYMDNICTNKKKGLFVTLIKNELLTECETRRTLGEKITQRLLDNDYAEWVNFPLSRTYHFFGVRFPMKDGVSSDFYKENIEHE
ncbi:MAG: hypothetical protein J6T10_25515 [Methanobrevibacter sp.]|nr:hypothetical protein [Methanobrevibacter sp.]